MEAEEGQRQGGGEREKTRKLFPNSSRERKREGKGEELREGLCIVSSSECSKCWQFFFLFFFFTVLFPIRSNRTRGRGREKREERREKSTGWKSWSCCERDTEKKTNRRGGVKDSGGRQPWTSEGLSLTLRWPRLAHCCWRSSSTHARLLTPVR